MSPAEREALVERQAIRELIGQYYYGIDARDRELIIGCFTEDVVYEFVREGRILRGIDQLRGTFGGQGGAAWSSHAVASQQIMVRGDRAEADTYAVAHLVEGAVAGPGVILVRGLRYLDELVRTADGWRIAHRRHNSLWQYEAASMSPDLSGRAAVFQSGPAGR